MLRASDFSLGINLVSWIKVITNGSMNKIPIGIIGVGMVGGAYADWFETQGHPIRRYDLFKRIGSLEEVNGVELVLIAVPTPFDEATDRFDGRAVESAVSSLVGMKTVIIKSTVLPGTTEMLQQRYPQHRILFSPEFLTESSAADDVSHPKINLIGYTEASRSVAPDVLSLFARAPFEKIMPSGEAELFKYLRNAFFATKVIFFNQMYDLCTKLGIDYEAIRECVAHDPWIGGQHTIIRHKGYRGYGGKCLPKDTRAFLRFSAEHGVNQQLLDVVDEINQKITAIPGSSTEREGERMGVKEKFESRVLNQESRQRRGSP